MASIAKVLYTAEATVVGGRKGHAHSSDGNLDIDLAPPTGMGGDNESKGTNPEQLFAAGYAACFLSALTGVAAGRKTDVSDACMDGRVDIGPTGHGGFGLAVTLDLKSPRLTLEEATELLRRAHERCPYSNATRGNVDVTLAFNGTPLE